MSDSADVLVIGGGPAGLSAAIAARQKGFNVTVTDGAEPPIDKTCGEGMMPGTMEGLRGLGVTIGCNEGFRFPGTRFVQEGAVASANFPTGHGIGFRRPLLHNKLIERAQECGVRLLWKTPVLGIDADGVMTAGAKLRARWIVGADGQGSRVRRWSDLESSRYRTQRFATRQHYHVKLWSEFMEIYWGERAQAYVTPIASDEVCVVMMGERGEDAAFGKALDSLPELKQRLRGAVPGSRERGGVTISRSLKRVHRGNIALLGDASGSVDAITGEGLRLAFRQALALADALVSGTLESYQRAVRELEWRPMLMGKLMLLLARNARLRRRVVGSFVRKPELFAKLLAFHVGEGGPADLVSTGAALGRQLLRA